MTLTATEFLPRFFLHVLPKGFVRIRHFGFLANRFRASRLTLGDSYWPPVAPRSCTLEPTMCGPRALVSGTAHAAVPQ